MTPDYIFETSWEVCNKIGGIYAVLSTRAASMQQEHHDRVFFLGPDISHDTPNPYFQENKTLLKSWQTQAAKEGLKIRVGRWQVPGKPIAILVDFNPFRELKNDIYYHFWEQYRVDSIAAYGDYDQSAVFGYATAVVIESIYRFYDMNSSRVVAHFNEWQTAFGLFYIKDHLPQIGTLFTTHATGIGRSIAGNNKPLYDYFNGYNGDQMARELNMVAKHSCEKTAAREAHCFTTVSSITDRECRQLLEKPADIVTPNGFESSFVPTTRQEFNRKRAQAQRVLRKVAQQVLGYKIPDDTAFLCTGGRYEFKNKGIDVVLHAAKQFCQMSTPDTRTAILFLMIPAWHKGAWAKLGINDHLTTHQLVEPQHDPILNTLQYLALDNNPNQPLKVIFVPSYLKGDDGIFSLSYYDLLLGMDLTLFPSYYEPWGYTPLESIAFHVPTITTDLAGFGKWADDTLKQQTDTLKPVSILHRTDSNFSELAYNIAHTILSFLYLTPQQTEHIRKQAANLAKKADWRHFFKYYRKAYDIALRKVKSN